MMIKTTSRAQIHETSSYGERMADRVAAIIGSWRFVLIQNGFVLLWMIINVIALFGFHADPYPFILLNLLFSWEASNAASALQMASNRQAAKDKARDDIEAKEVQGLYDNHTILLQINQQQLDILERIGAKKKAANTPRLRGVDGRFVKREQAA